MAAKCVVLDTWAGRRYYAVEVLGETPKKARIRVLTPGDVMLPNRRYVQCGEIALVPMHAIYDMPADGIDRVIELEHENKQLTECLLKANRPRP